MKTVLLPTQPDVKSPAGAVIRFLIAGATGSMIHSTVPPHQINKATVHATVHEFWYVLEGQGEIWRDDGSQSFVTALVLAPRSIFPPELPFNTEMSPIRK